jgi:hypothetical protein
MNPKNPKFDPNRRRFIGACCAAVSATGMLSTLAQLRMMGAVASPTNGPQPARAGALPPDYKALVCLFLAGGNDANNMIVPFDTNGYNAYASAAGRGAISLPRTQLLGITPKTSDGREWALHTSMNADVAGANNTGLKSLFDEGKMALIGNVGTLVVPTTKAQYNARSVPLPPQLFSHNDQQVEWQSSIADKPFTTGWGGRVADLVDAMNANSSVSMAISLAVRRQPRRSYFAVRFVEQRHQRGRHAHAGAERSARRPQWKSFPGRFRRAHHQRDFRQRDGLWHPEWEHPVHDGVLGLESRPAASHDRPAHRRRPTARRETTDLLRPYWRLGSA